METTKKITPQEFIAKLRERAEKAKAEGRTATIPAQHAEMMKKFRERAEKMKAEGKTIKTMPMSAKHSELIAKLRERAVTKANLKVEDLKKAEVTEIEKKEE